MDQHVMLARMMWGRQTQVGPRGPQKFGGSMGWKDINETYKCSKYDPP